MRLSDLNDAQRDAAERMHDELTGGEVTGACRTYGVRNYSGMRKLERCIRLAAMGITRERIHDDIFRATEGDSSPDALNLDSMITGITDDPSTGEANIGLTERGRAVLADLLDMVQIPATTDPLERLEADNVRTLLDELKRLA